jgi:hypothetical protein
MTLSERSVRCERGGSTAHSRWRSRLGADEVHHDAADVLSTNLIALAATLMYPPPLTDGKLRLPRQLVLALTLLIVSARARLHKGCDRPSASTA